MTNHGGDGMLLLLHAARQILHLLARVAENHRLRDVHRVVQVAQRLELPLLKNVQNLFDIKKIESP